MTGKAKGRTRAAAVPQRGGVRSVQLAAAILKALADADGAVPLKGVAAVTGLARAKVHRYLTSLRYAGLVAQNAATGHYQIGPAAMTIGLAGLRRLSPVAEVSGALSALRDTVNQTVTAAVWSEAGPIVVAMQESTHWATMNIRVGSRLPILTTAIGRLFLAHLPESKVRSLVAAERHEARSGEPSPPTADELDGMLGEIRARRLSRAPSALLPGVDAIAAPVFDHRNDLVAVICVVARADAEITGWNGSAVRALTATAAEVSERLGFIGDPLHPASAAPIADRERTRRKTAALSRLK